VVIQEEVSSVALKGMERIEKRLNNSFHFALAVPTFRNSAEVIAQCAKDVREDKCLDSINVKHSYFRT